MPTPILATKLYVPRPRPKMIVRPRLIERLNEGLRQDKGFGRKLTLISAPAGFGKTTLVSSWMDDFHLETGEDGQTVNQVAWLSLDDGDNDVTRFLAYLVAALQTIAPTIGDGVLTILQSPQPPAAEAVLTPLLNDIALFPDNVVLVLDDYHVLDAQPVDHALAFLIEHLPPQMHVVISTREDPNLPLARWRVRGQLRELRAADLRFTAVEAAAFLNQGMGLNLSAENISALETRTEGWIAGLQLAALAMQGDTDRTSFIQSFSGSHRFVLDYLVEEVLQQQSASVQAFLLRTSILDRLCGSLCDAVVGDDAASGQKTLEAIEQANLFIVPLDNERRWYRYHHLFADLLRQRLQQSRAPTGDAGGGMADLHHRASVWYEAHGLEIEAFHHAVAAHDVARAARLVEGQGMPLLFRGAVAPVLNWLAALPTAELDARPSLWVLYASALVFVGQTSRVEEKLQAAEAILQLAVQNDENRDHLGHIAAIRATLAIPQQQVETIIAQSQRALAYLHPHNLPVRTATTWTLGFAYQLQGDRVAAGRAYAEASASSEAMGHIVINIAATTGVGYIQEAGNQLYEAAETYRRVLQLTGDPPWPVTCEAHLGLARVHYQWNDLEAAEQQAQRGIQLARQLASIDTSATCEVLLARLKLAQGDGAGAAALLASAEQFVRQRHFRHLLPQIAAVQVLVLLQQGDLLAAVHLAERYDLPLSQARIHLAKGDTAAALVLLAAVRQRAEAKGWADERLRAVVLQAVAYGGLGEWKTAVSHLTNALILAEPNGFVRLFVDEGPQMVALLQAAAQQGVASRYVGQLLAALGEAGAETAVSRPLSDPLSERELAVLKLLGTELSGPDIARELMVSLNTLRTHTKNIYSKLGVNSRRTAVRRAEELDLL